ncbi:putative spermidine/putrescine transport system ATP-binding protein [Devosia sp. YR412]|uniref:ABC transporter ATP-binding protein n=1 Tax=Devosia sp. YR412 TaxID=1881030 RepID=UPI0008C6A428|nr:ABC transporter ATP-binding protein [Devosia sp. YR412]SEQ07634.1 putative spermidine/putrescine transport system ATP-binding protein [Devosia sp. YR412]
MAAFLEVNNLVKSFGSNTVVKGVNFAFDKGEFISLLGPSGCGKTTILRMIAGFENPTSGSIKVDGQDITGLKPNQRQLGMVFQAYALFPNLNVGDNIGFGLKIAGMPADERRARVDEMLKLIGLPGFEKRYPYEMSGGQQQRVALARAIAPRPRMLLLDEPLSALDAKIRVSLREEIRAIQLDLGITTVFVTHDQEEALSISDRIVVMNAGNIDQLGAPHEIYNKPATRFVATFVGHLNTIEATVLDAAAKTVSIDGQTATVPALPTTANNGSAVSLTLRPEVLAVGAREGSDITLTGTIADVTFLGSVIRLRVQLGQNVVSLDTFNDQRTAPPARGEPVTISLASKDLLVL